MKLVLPEVLFLPMALAKNVQSLIPTTPGSRTSAKKLALAAHAGVKKLQAAKLSSVLKKIPYSTRLPKPVSLVRKELNIMLLRTLAKTFAKEDNFTTKTRRNVFAKMASSSMSPRKHASPSASPMKITSSNLTHACRSANWATNITPLWMLAKVFASLAKSSVLPSKNAEVSAKQAIFSILQVKVAKIFAMKPKFITSRKRAVMLSAVIQRTSTLKQSNAKTNAK